MGTEGYISIEAIRKGDAAEFKKLIHVHYNQSYHYAKTLARNEELAKDIVQDVFLVLWENRQTINSNTVIKGWLFRTIKNKFIDHARKNKRQVLSLELHLANTMDDIFKMEENEQLDQKIGVLEKEIHHLPNKCREVFLLSKKEGLSNEEIAEYLQVSQKTVEGHLTNAFKVLRERLYMKIRILFVCAKVMVIEND